MTDDTITRRRIVQGIGALGLAPLVGGPVSAQEATETGATTTADETTAALRVAHAVADAPAVDVRLTTAETAGMDTDETETDDGTVTEGTGTEGEEASAVSVSGLEFGGVTEYQELDPGSYRLEIVAAGGGLVEQILDIFEGDSEDETVIFQETVEVDAETTYTAVAFGELAEGPAGGGTDTTATETETGDGADETETEGDDSAADSDSADTASLTVETDRGLQVEVLEDDLTAPDDGMARLRVFHAVPDANTVSITADGGDESTETAAEEGQATATDADGGAETTATDGGAEMETTLVDALSYGESATVEVEAGEYSLTVRPVSETADEESPTETEAEMDGTETEAEMDETAQETRTVTVAVDGGGVYSGFAVGYFDPETAAGQPVGAGGTDNETEMGNESGGQDDGDRAQRVRNRDFELVTVQDAEDGERLAGSNRAVL